MMQTYLAYEDRQIPLIEAPDHPSSETALEAIMASRPETIALRGVAGIRDIQQVSSRVAVQEALLDLTDGYTKLWAIIGETPESIRALTLSWPPLPRVSGLVFSPFPLLAELKLSSNALFDQWPDFIRMGRNLTVLMALGLNLPAYECVSSDADPSRAKALALRDGFSGVVKM
jgi:citrate lyase beta subunit